MEQYIPFKKNIIFKTKVDNISSISLKHDFKLDDDVIAGVFLVSGEYRSTEASLIGEDFFQKLPFEIALSDRIKKETVDLKIEDFKYNLIDSNTLRLDIKLFLTCEESSVAETKEEESEEDELENLEYLLDLEEEREEKPKINEESKENIKEEVEDRGFMTEKDLGIENFNLVSNIVKDNKKYVTYKVYIAKEYEDLNYICTKYNVSKEQLSEYNNISEINVGDKIIIPYVNGE